MTGLLMNLVGTTAVLFTPFSTAVAAKQDGWMGSILATVYAAFIIYIVYRLGMLFPDKSLIEYLPLILGKVAGKILGVLYIIFLFYLTSSVLREAMAIFLGTGAYKFTPPIVLSIVLVIASTYGLLLGFEVISRTMGIYLVLIASFYVLTLCLAIPYMKLETLLPMGEAGFANIFKASLVPFAYRGELFLLAMVLPFMKSPREGFIAANIANILLGILISFMVLTMIVVLGAETTGRSIYALFFLADFIPPIGTKIYLLSFWVVAFWGKIMLLQFIISNGISQLLNLKSYHYIVIPVGALLVVLSFTFYKNVPDMLISIPATFPGVALFFEYLIPTLLLIIALVKSKFVNNAKPAPAADNSQS